MKKKRDLSLGETFAIPRSDGKWVLGQAVEEYIPGIWCVAVFDKVLTTLEDAGKESLAGLAVLSMPSVTRSNITEGHWPRVGLAEMLVDIQRSPHHKFKEQGYVGSEQYGGGIVEALVDAYYGIKPWHHLYGYEKLLRSLLMIDARVFVQPVTEEGPRPGEPTRTSSDSPPSEEHDVVIHFKYGSSDLQSLFEMEERIDRAIVDAEVGVLGGNEVATDCSNGFLFLHGPNADRLYEVIKPILEEVPFMHGAKVTLRYGPSASGVAETSIVVGR